MWKRKEGRGKQGRAMWKRKEGRGKWGRVYGEEQKMNINKDIS